MMLRFAIILILLINTSAAGQAKRSPEEIAAKKAARAERKAKKKRQKELRKQKKAEAKRKRIEARKKKLEERKKLMTYTKEDEIKLDRIMGKFTNYLGKDKTKYNYKIVKSANFNAYATLGRKMGINSSLFHKIKSETGLAAIIAHELGHVERKHVAKGVGVAVARGATAAVLDSFTGGIGGSVFRGASSVAQTAYTRSNERQADLFAIDLMIKVYCDVPGKLDGYEAMKKEGSGSQTAPYLSTHPLTQKRIDYMTTLIKDAGCVL